MRFLVIGFVSKWIFNYKQIFLIGSTVAGERDNGFNLSVMICRQTQNNSGKNITNETLKGWIKAKKGGIVINNRDRISFFESLASVSLSLSGPDRLNKKRRWENAIVPIKLAWT